MFTLVCYINHVVLSVTTCSDYVNCCVFSSVTLPAV